MRPRVHEAYEILVEDGGTSPVVICCEHASNDLHRPWGPDERLRDTHWAWDPGAAAMARDLARAFGSRGVLARFSRLLVDANRPLYSGTLFRDDADGMVQLNHELPDAERLERIRRWWTPYHDALDEVCAAAPAQILLSIHSFTRDYQDHPPREVEVGVLFENDERMAARIREGIARRTRREVRLNEPYSGKGGMMYSCYSHARNNGLYAIELELRQDLLADRAIHDQLLAAIVEAVPEALAGGPE